jgi:hypothetical protein
MSTPKFSENTELTYQNLQLSDFEKSVLSELGITSSNAANSNTDTSVIKKAISGDLVPPNY